MFSGDIKGSKLNENEDICFGVQTFEGVIHGIGGKYIHGSSFVRI